MNDYLIDPMMFYWMGMADSLITFCGAMAVVLGLILAITITCWIAFKLNEEERGKVLFRNTSIFCIVLFFLFSGAAIFVPDRTTLIQMAVAKQVTHSNIKVAKDEIKSAVDYIFEKVKEIK